MSERLKNYPSPMAVINDYGADALRLYIVNSPVVRAEPLRFKVEGVMVLYLCDPFFPPALVTRTCSAAGSVFRLTIDGAISSLHNVHAGQRCFACHGAMHTYFLLRIQKDLRSRACTIYTFGSGHPSNVFQYS